MKRIAKLITAQISIDENPNEYSTFEELETMEKTLVLKNVDTGGVEIVHLPQGKSSICFIKDETLNEGSFVKFAEDDVYEELDVFDKTELNIVLNKLTRAARELTV